MPGEGNEADDSEFEGSIDDSYFIDEGGQDAPFDADLDAPVMAGDGSTDDSDDQDLSQGGLGNFTPDSVAQDDGYVSAPELDGDLGGEIASNDDVAFDFPDDNSSDDSIDTSIDDGSSDDSVISDAPNLDHMIPPEDDSDENGY